MHKNNRQSKFFHKTVSSLLIVILAHQHLWSLGVLETMPSLITMRQTGALVPDELDRIIEMTFLDNVTTRYSYESDSLENWVVNKYSKPISVTDPNGNKTASQYDELGRLVTQTDAEGNMTEYVYNDLGQVIEVKNAKGQITKFGYDQLGRKVREINPIGGEIRYQYNEKNQLEIITDLTEPNQELRKCGTVRY